MSDETPPTPLRLKPRQQTPAADTSADSAGVDEGKLRLKPKLTEEVEETAPAAEPEPEVAEPEMTEPPVIEPVRSKPKLTLAPDPEPEPEPEAVAEEAPAEVDPEAESTPPPMPLPEEGKIKLKIKLPGGAAQEATIPPTEEPPSLPPFPVVAPPPPEGEEMEAPPLLPPAERTAAPFPATLPPGGSRPAVFKRPRIPAAILAAERRKRMLKYAAIAAGGIVLAGIIIFGAYLKFTEPPKVVVPVRPKFVPPPPIVVVAPPAPKPAPVVEPPPVEPGAGTRVATSTTVEIAPGITATTESIKAVPNASSQFKQFVASAKVSGVYQGNPPRAFINGRLVHTGEMIDDVQEIYFDSIDVPNRSLVFKDGRGATVSRRY